MSYLERKGGRLMCENYHGISLLNAACEVLSVILFRRPHPTDENKYMFVVFKATYNSTDKTGLWRNFMSLEN
jgi:hypothetical protein